MTLRRICVGALALAGLLAAQDRKPDKVLLDSAVQDIQHKRFERARIQLQTLVNTYSTSEFLPAAKFAVCDSWYREGGKKGIEQAEAECKDVMLFYPNTLAASDAKKVLDKIEEARAKKK